jgi:phosphoadenosine phosphosulfate reductase
MSTTANTTPELDADEIELAAELDAASERLEHASAAEIVAWTAERFGDDLVLASSFQDAVLIDVAVKVTPRIRVLFLDTGFHFPETIAYMRRLERDYSLNLEILESGLAPDVSPCGSPNCCDLRKVAPLNKVLDNSAAWITGLKRVDTPERRNAPVVSYDPARKIAKVNPLATWTDEQVDEYIAEHSLARHPLNYVGYISIGCAPTTRPVAPGEDPRAGRWPDSDKTECGLHI